MSTYTFISHDVPRQKYTFLSPDMSKESCLCWYCGTVIDLLNKPNFPCVMNHKLPQDYKDYSNAKRGDIRSFPTDIEKTTNKGAFYVMGYFHSPLCRDAFILKCTELDLPFFQDAMSYQRSYDFSQSKDRIPTIPTILDIDTHAPAPVDFFSYKGWIRHIVLVQYGGILTEHDFEHLSRKSDIIPKWEAECPGPEAIGLTEEGIPIYPIQIDVECDQPLLCYPRAPTNYIKLPHIKTLLPIIKEGKVSSSKRPTRVSKRL